MNGSDILVLVDISHLSHDFAAADVDTTGNDITVVGHTLLNNDTVVFSTTGTLPAPLVAGTTYHIVGVAADIFQVSATSGGAAIDLTTQGTGTHTVERTGPADYGVVASQRDVTFDESTAEINMSSKDSRAAKADPGRYSATCTLDSLYVADDAGYLEMKRAMRTGVEVRIRRREVGSDVEEAPAVITSLSERGPDQAEATVSASFTINGIWEAVA